jgi:hypothetical protein
MRLHCCSNVPWRSSAGSPDAREKKFKEKKEEKKRCKHLTAGPKAAGPGPGLLPGGLLGQGGKAHHVA